jgi:hypothetical protein
LRNPADDSVMRHRTGLGPDVHAHVLAVPGARELISRTAVRVTASVVTPGARVVQLTGHPAARRHGGTAARRHGGTAAAA